MTAILGMGALAVDTGHFYVEQNRLQATADSTVLAASHVLRNGGDEQAASNAALEYAQMNLPPKAFGTVLSAQDVVQGEWDENAYTFPPAARPMPCR